MPFHNILGQREQKSKLNRCECAIARFDRRGQRHHLHKRAARALSCRRAGAPRAPGLHCGGAGTRRPSVFRRDSGTMKDRIKWSAAANRCVSLSVSLLPLRPGRHLGAGLASLRKQTVSSLSERDGYQFWARFCVSSLSRTKLRPCVYLASVASKSSELSVRARKSLLHGAAKSLKTTLASSPDTKRYSTTRKQGAASPVSVGVPRGAYSCQRSLQSPPF